MKEQTLKEQTLKELWGSLDPNEQANMLQIGRAHV